MGFKIDNILKNSLLFCHMVLKKNLFGQFIRLLYFHKLCSFNKISLREEHKTTHDYYKENEVFVVRLSHSFLCIFFSPWKTSTLHTVLQYFLPSGSRNEYLFFFRGIFDPVFSNADLWCTSSITPGDWARPVYVERRIKVMDYLSFIPRFDLCFRRNSWSLNSYFNCKNDFTTDVLYAEDW